MRRRDGILLKARLKADFLLSSGGAKLFSRRTSDVCGPVVKPSPTLGGGEMVSKQNVRETHIKSEN